MQRSITKQELRNIQQACNCTFLPKKIGGITPGKDYVIHLEQKGENGQWTVNAVRFSIGLDDKCTVTSGAVTWYMAFSDLRKRWSQALDFGG